MFTRTLATGSADDRPTRKHTQYSTARRLLSATASAALFLTALAGVFSTGTAAAAAPRIGTNPGRLSATLAPGQSETQTLTVLNNGGDPLIWNVLNQNTTIRTFRRDAAITLNPIEYMLASAVVDPAGRFAYFGTSSPPGQVIKIDLQTFERVGAITLQDGANEDGEKFLLSGVMDPAGKYAYFGTSSYPGKVVKIDLQTFERVGAVTLDSGEDVLRSAVIDPSGNFAYFGTDSYPANIVKIDLRTFSRVGAIQLSEDLSFMESAAAIDLAGQFAYFGVGFGSVVKIDLAHFEFVSSIDTGVATLLASALIDPSGQFAYFGTYDAPGRIVKVKLADFTLNGMLTLAPGEDRPAAAVMAADGAFAYFGTRQTSPGRVVKIDLASFTRAGAITLNAGEDDLRAAVRDPVHGDLYFGTTTFPGRVVKISDVQRNCALPAWATVTPGSGTVVGGASQTAAVAFNAASLTPGIHEAALCLQSNDTATPLIAVPLALDLRLAEVSPRTLAFDVIRGGTDTNPLSIVNRASSDLGWTIAQADPVQGCSVPANPSWLSVSPISGTVAPGDATKIGVTVNAATVPAGAEAVQLCVTLTSGANSQTRAIPVNLTVREPTPVISIAPGSLSVTLPSGQSGSSILSVLNTGAGPLNWSILNENIGPRLDDTLLLDGSKSLTGAAVVDAAGRYAYFGTNASPGQVVKVDLATFARVATITLAAGENFLQSAVIDSAARFAYFGTRTSPGSVVKIDLASFQRVDAIALEAGEDNLGAAVIDPAGAFAYFGTSTDPASVVKINLANFTRVGAITLMSNQDESFLQAAVIDPSGAFAYFGGGPLVGNVVKIDLASFQRTGAVTLANDQGLSAGVIDATGRYAYFGTSPPYFGVIGHVIRLDLASFEVTGVLDLEIANYEWSVTAAVIDPHSQFGYFATRYGSATRLVEVDLNNFSRVGPISLGVAEGGIGAAVIDPTGKFAYFGGQLYPGVSDRRGRVFKIERRQQCVLPTWLTPAESNGSISAGSTHSLGVGINTSGLMPGVYTANLCFASNDPAQPLRDAAVELTVPMAGDRIFANGFDPSLL